MLPLSEGSKQDWRTPKYVLEYAKRRWGEISIDMAATAENRVAESWCEGEDEKKPPKLGLWQQNYWCNPPFAQSKIWVRSALWAAEDGITGTMILRADLGAEYSLELYRSGAEIVVLTPRVRYVGENAREQRPSFASMLVRTHQKWYRGKGSIEIVELREVRDR